MTLKKLDVPPSSSFELAEKISTTTQLSDKDKVHDTLLKISSHLLDPKCKNRAKDWQINFTSASMYLDVNRCTVKNTRKVAAAALVLSSIRDHEQSLYEISAAVEAGALRPVFYIERLMYDETPLRMKVENSPGMAKLLQSEFEWAVCLQDVATGAYIISQSWRPTWVQVIDRNTAECLLAATSDIIRRHPMVHEIFKDTPKLLLATTDEYGGNDRCERRRLLNDPEWVTAKLPCLAHKSVTVGAKTNSLVADDVTGLTNFLLSLMHTGQMQSFKIELENVITDMLEVVYEADPLSEAAVLYKSSLLANFCSGSALGPDTLAFQ